MQTPKFRAWHKELKEFVHVEKISFDANGILTDIKCYDVKGADCWWEYLCNVELMQWTGLQDENGVDIYEGDIVAIEIDLDSTKELLRVIWHKEMAAFRCVWPDGCDDTIWSVYRKNSGIIIGNIYESPELLNAPI